MQRLKALVSRAFARFSCEERRLIPTDHEERPRQGGGARHVHQEPHGSVGLAERELFPRGPLLKLLW